MWHDTAVWTEDRWWRKTEFRKNNFSNRASIYHIPKPGVFWSVSSGQYISIYNPNMNLYKTFLSKFLVGLDIQVNFVKKQKRNIFNKKHTFCLGVRTEQWIFKDPPSYRKDWNATYNRGIRVHMQTAIHISIIIIHKQHKNLVQSERYGAHKSDSTFVFVIYFLTSCRQWSCLERDGKEIQYLADDNVG